MNYVSMVFYFLASAMLIMFAFTNKNIFLFLGAGVLVIAVLLGSLFKKKP